MVVWVSGAGGFIGSAAVEWLQTQGHSIVRLVRPPAASDTSTLLWDPAAGTIQTPLHFPDAVVHLAGEPVFGLWTRAKKQRILDSRVSGTARLAEYLSNLHTKPAVFICASAVGFYGDRGDQVLTETSPAGNGFLCHVCQQWEAAAEPARQAGIRVACLRFGVVLARHGGALAKMLPPFRIGLGGTLGSGNQWTSWITLTDALRAIEFVIQNRTLSGAVNVVAPQPVRNRELTQLLGKTLRRPTPLPVPAAILRMMLGDFAKETLLASTRAVPEKLLGAGFEFQHTALHTALQETLM